MTTATGLPMTLFPDAVISARATEAMWNTPVSPAEEAQILRAVPKRQREFRAGRHCAHLLLQHFNHVPFDLLNDAQRVPVWPDGFKGSISHCDDFCAAALTNDPSIRSLGLDIEAALALPDDTRALICHPHELKNEHLVDPCWDRIIFSAKESFYKAYFPLCRQFLDFLEAEVVLEAPQKTAQGLQGDYQLRLLNSAPPALYNQQVFYGRYACFERWIITGMTIKK